MTVPEFREPERRAEKDADGAIRWREVPYATIQGFRPLVLDVLTPGQGAAWPLLIYVHGGAWFKGNRNALPPTIADMQVFEKLIGAGIAVATVAYRLSSEARFPAQLHDVKAAVRFLRANAAEFGIDPERFAAWGESAGGHLVTLLGLTGNRPDLEGDVGVIGPSSAVQAVIDWYGPSDLLSMNRQSLPDSAIDHDAPDSPEARLIGSPVQTTPDKARHASPLTYVHSKSPPFLVVHGDRDHLVPVGQSIALADALRTAGADVELVVVPGADHVFIGDPNIKDRIDELVAFLGKHLRKRS